MPLNTTTSPQHQKQQPIVVTRKPVVQQVSSLHQAFPAPQPQSRSLSLSAAGPSSSPSSAVAPSESPPPPPTMPPPPIPTSSPPSEYRDATSPAETIYNFSNNYNSGTSANPRSVSANQQYAAYNPASPNTTSTHSSTRPKDSIDTAGTPTSTASSRSPTRINEGFDFDFAQPAPAPRFDFEVAADSSSEMTATAARAGRSESPAGAARRNFTSSPDAGHGSWNASPAQQSITPIQQGQRQAHSQPQSGRSTPVRPSPPEIHLTGTTPSPETERRPQFRRARSNSLQGLAGQKLRVGTGDSTLIPSDLKARSSSAQPPITRTTDVPQQPRVVSTGTRPVSQAAALLDSSSKGKVRKSLFLGGRSRSNSQDLPRIHNSAAWIISDDSSADYNTYFLTSGEKVPELWNDSSNVYVHIHPRESGRGPCFKVPTTVLSSSGIFRRQMREQLPPTDAPTDKPREYHVRVSSTSPDLERLITIRNLFAFLTGQPLVATKTQPTLFKVLVNVSSLLVEFEFSSPDGETYGEIPDVCFSWIMTQVPLADVRNSREKTIEALVLGERMRSKELYHEAFAHAAGKYAAIKALKSPTFGLLSATTQARLERSHLDLVNRQDTLNNKLEQFEFPALFAGIAGSNSANRDVNFARWKAAFGRMRSFVLGYYRSAVGSWPPKASSKKNNFSESGLNRQVLKMLYSDLCALYDLLVDREALSPRIEGGDPPAEPDPHSDDENNVSIHYLRKMLNEYDTSTPPVVPPIPFDIPQIPNMVTIYETYYALSAKEQQAFDRKVQHHELLLVLSKAYNIDTYKLKLPFLEAFKEFEAKEARGLAGGKSLAEIVDQRMGYWLFLYAVIQALPMLVVDAPDVKYTGNVEYFLCQPPMGPLPWIEDSGRKMWFEVANGFVVELPPEAVKYSVQATYHRSHCWLSAKVWEEALNFGTAGRLPPPPADDQVPSPLDPPNPGFAEGSAVAAAGQPTSDAGTSKSAGASPALPPLTAGTSPSGSPQYALRPRNLSPAARARAFAPGGPGGHVYRSSIALGIEPLALPENDYPGRRHVSSGLEDSSYSGPSSDKGMPRSASHGNLRHLTFTDEYGSSGDAPRGGSPLARPGNPGTVSAESPDDDSADHTFDNILSKVDKRQRRARKWGLF